MQTQERKGGGPERSKPRDVVTVITKERANVGGKHFLLIKI